MACHTRVFFQYGDQNMQSQCKPCSVGKEGLQTGFVMESQCSDCNGTLLCDLPYSRAKITCLAVPFIDLSFLCWFSCLAGKYADSEDGLARCKNCEMGRYGTETAATSVSQCKPCELGKYINETGHDEAIDCKSCPSGRFGSTTGMPRCDACPGGKFGNGEIGCSGSDDQCCNQCGIGKFQNELGTTSSSQCKACLAGKYNDDMAQNACKNCTLGR